ncbi:FoF1-type ATP synthase [Commensalibacter communis]|uniref:F0F1 ATP synthase subunit gamma n=1 Tax=Commensalibacter communis TaxID=2972786 RepID=UPI0022FF968D|nr:F0F1 ATP synthase subunit gamma [Commensalibacter communis]CAI3922945.1 FoF1-type ATP synthase [Commensalibacter communis]CAI3936485.1 FoF1-type ATP synthase [Commensalibacter communis]
MASLKELRARINSVKSTKKITSAMKMVAAAKMNRAERRSREAKPFATTMQRILVNLKESLGDRPGLPKLLAGTGKQDIHLIIPMSSDRGLAGGFNGNINRATRGIVEKLLKEGKNVKICPIGFKSYVYFRGEYPNLVVGPEGGDHRLGNVTFDTADQIASYIEKLLQDEQCDVCTVVYNQFKNVMLQVPTELPLIPLNIAATEKREETLDEKLAVHTEQLQAEYLFEPEPEEVLHRLLPQNLRVQLFSAMLETNAGEQGARMTAMDSATRNAGKAIDKLSLHYNRTRQANITNELTEVISGANAA